MSDRPALYVDIQDTLIHLEVREGKLRRTANAGLMVALCEFARMGHPIIFHTGDASVQAQEDVVRQLVKDPLLLTYLPVRSKYTLRGKTIGIAIDDLSKDELLLRYGFRTIEHIPSGRDLIPIDDAAYYREQITAAAQQLTAQSVATPFNHTATKTPLHWLRRMANKLGL
jgi:hypothetical protein